MVGQFYTTSCKYIIGCHVHEHVAMSKALRWYTQSFAVVQWYTLGVAASQASSGEGGAGNCVPTFL